MNLLILLTISLSPTWFNLPIKGDEAKKAFLEAYGQYGWFYWMWIVLLVIETFLLIYFVARKHDSKKDRIVVLSYGLTLFVAEIYKEVLFGIECGHYPWNLFPWQFCSVPMFVMIVVGLLKQGKVQDALYKFLTIYALFAGVIATILPEGFYWNYITITIHSFFWHTSMIAVAIYLIVAKGYAKSIKNYIKDVIPATIVLVSVIAIAMILNEIGYNFIQYPASIKYSNLEANEYKTIMDSYYFSMFYISHYHTCSLPILRDIQPNVPYIVFLLIYILGFMLSGSIFYLISVSINKLVSYLQGLNKKKVKVN